MYERWPPRPEKEGKVEDVNLGAVSGRNAPEYEEREKKGGESSPGFAKRFCYLLSSVSFPPLSLPLLFSARLLSLFRSRHRRRRLGASRAAPRVFVRYVQLVYDAGIEAKFARRWWKPDITPDPCYPSRHVSRTGWVVPVPTHATARPPPSNDTRASVVRESQLSFCSSPGLFSLLPCHLS